MSVKAAFIVPHPPLIVPEIGQGGEAIVQETIQSFHEVAQCIAALAPQTVVLISPHSTTYADYIHLSPGEKATGSFRQFGGKQLYSVNYDAQLVQEICRLCDEEGFPAGTLGERDTALDHGTLVPLHFLNQYYTDYRLIRCSVSGLSLIQHYRFGMIINQAIAKLNRQAVIIASGDLSHRLSDKSPYGFAPEGPRLDAALTGIMRSGAFGDFLTMDEALSEQGGDCGLRGFVIMAGALDNLAVEPNFYSYQGVTGVGYAICQFTPGKTDDKRRFLTREQERMDKLIADTRANEDAFTTLARAALESYLTTGQLPTLPVDLPEELVTQKAGVFVSLKKHGQLRGCIGTTEPTTGSIAQEIRQNALSAGLRDPRFQPVTATELKELVYSVDVLSQAQPCQKEQLNPKVYGVIVSSGNKRGLLLPDLAGVDTVEQQIEIACQKAGIGKDEQYTLERFKVTRHK